MSLKTNIDLKNSYEFFRFLGRIPKSLKYHEFESEMLENDISNDDEYDYNHYSEKNRILDDIKSDPQRAKKYNWLNSDGELNWPKYRVNKYGYRTSLEYKNGTSIALGCSYTFGLGVHEEQTWPYLLSKKINKDIINLGICGGSMDSSYRALKSYTEKYTPEYVFFSIPSALRQHIQYRRDDNRVGTLKIMPGSEEWEEDEQRKMLNSIMLKNFYSLDENIFVNFHKNLEAIRYLCNSKNIKLIECLNPVMYNPDEILEKWGLNHWPEKYSSFDPSHFGPEIYEIMIKDFLKLL
jgi:hypothetical protein